MVSTSGFAKTTVCLVVLLVALGWGSIAADERTPQEEAIAGAVGGIEAEIEETQGQIQTTIRDPDWRGGNSELVSFVQEARRKAANLRAVLAALRRSRISYGNTGGAVASSDAGATPPTITLGPTLVNAPTAAVAEYLGHEAIHIIDGDVNNASIDEEVRAFEKQAEIWEALKGPRDTFNSCDTVSRIKARGAAALRRAVKSAYPNLPDHPPP